MKEFVLKLLGKIAKSPKESSYIFRIITDIGPVLDLLLIARFEIAYAMHGPLSCSVSRFDDRHTSDTIGSRCFGSQVWSAHTRVDISSTESISVDPDINFAALR